MPPALFIIIDIYINSLYCTFILAMLRSSSVGGGPPLKIDTIESVQRVRDHRRDDLHRDSRSLGGLDGGCRCINDDVCIKY